MGWITGLARVESSKGWVELQTAQFLKKPKPT